MLLLCVTLEGGLTGDVSQTNGNMAASKTSRGAVSTVLAAEDSNVLTSAGGIEDQGAVSSGVNGRFLSAASANGVSATTSLNSSEKKKNGAEDEGRSNIKADDDSQSTEDSGRRPDLRVAAGQISASLKSGPVATGGILGASRTDRDSLVLGSVGSSAPGVSTSLSAGQLTRGTASRKAVRLFSRQT